MSSNNTENVFTVARISENDVGMRYSVEIFVQGIDSPVIGTYLGSHIHATTVQNKATGRNKHTVYLHTAGGVVLSFDVDMTIDMQSSLTFDSRKETDEAIITHYTRRSE